eukprot:SM000142S00543  [mRNA]  locus=s142:191970:194202:+ [translate_table: standard]
MAALCREILPCPQVRRTELVTGLACLCSQKAAFEAVAMGFFAEAGPVQIFVSNHLIPDDYEFQTGDEPRYASLDGQVKIQKNSEVRLKIVGTRVDATEIRACWNSEMESVRSREEGGRGMSKYATP